MDPAATELTPGSTTLVRRIAQEPLSFLASDSVVARYPGGVLDAGTLARLILELPQGAAGSLAGADGEELRDFIHEAVARSRLVREAEEASEVDVDGIRERETERYREELAEFWHHARLWPDSLRHESPHEDLRIELARWRVDQYLEAVAARRVPMEPLPSLLAARLLEDARWGVVPGGVDEAIAMAERLLAAAGYTGPGDLPVGTGGGGP